MKPPPPLMKEVIGAELPLVLLKKKLSMSYKNKFLIQI